MHVNQLSQSDLAVIKEVNLKNAMDNNEESKDKVECLSSNSFLDRRKSISRNRLSDCDVGNLDDDQPFNFNLERFDSLMVDSDDSYNTFKNIQSNKRKSESVVNKS
jgi:hypothetical protein